MEWAKRHFKVFYVQASLDGTDGRRFIIHNTMRCGEAKIKPLPANLSRITFVPSLWLTVKEADCSSRLIKPEVGLAMIAAIKAVDS